MDEKLAPPARRSMLDLLLGASLADGDDHESVAHAAGIAVYGLDALSSAAYGPEAALTVLIAHPAAEAGLSLPQLVVLSQPYRFVTSSIVEYILNLERIHPDRMISVVLPELVERRWFYDFLHSQRAALLKIKFYIKGNGHIIVTNVPWYLSA